MENQIIGVWQLIDFSFCDNFGNPKFKPFGKNIDGLLIYTNNGFMSANLGNLERKKFINNDYRLGEKDEIIEAFNNMISYSGQFEIIYNKNYIIHKIKMSMFPNWINQNVKRFFRIGYYDKIIGDNKLKISFKNNLKDKDIFLELSATEILHIDELLTPKLTWQKIRTS